MNALYLDAPWKYKFDPMQTRQAPFKRLDGSTAMVDMMHYDEFLPSAGSQEWSAVELPYQGDELSMVVIVPEDLRRFETRLTPELLGEVLGAIKEGGIHLSFPKVNFSFHASLKKTLEGLGLASLFTDADFSGITGAAAPRWSPSSTRSSWTSTRTAPRPPPPPAPPSPTLTDRRCRWIGPSCSRSGTSPRERCCSWGAWSIPGCTEERIGGGAEPSRRGLTAATKRAGVTTRPPDPTPP